MRYDSAVFMIPHKLLLISKLTLFLVVMIFAGVLLVGCSQGVGAKDAEDRAAPLVMRATAKTQEGDTAGAVKMLREALDENPKLARAHFDLAVLLHNHEEDYIAAIYHYRRYLALRPETEKREMIKDRIRSAGQMFIAKQLKRTGHSSVQSEEAADVAKISKLKKENEALVAKVKELETNLLNQKKTLQVRQPRKHLKNPRGLDSGFQTITYKVRSGDSLTSIALANYGDADMASKIYAANKSRLKDPNHLLVGQVLVIP